MQRVDIKSGSATWKKGIIRKISRTMPLYRAVGGAQDRLDIDIRQYLRQMGGRLVPGLRCGEHGPPGPVVVVGRHDQVL